MAKGTFKCMASGMWSIYELLVRKAWTPSPAILGHHDFRDLEWISVPCQIEPCKGAQVPFALQKALYTRISNTRSLLIIQKEKEVLNPYLCFGTWRKSPETFCRVWPLPRMQRFWRPAPLPCPSVHVEGDGRDVNGCDCKAFGQGLVSWCGLGGFGGLVVYIWCFCCFCCLAFFEAMSIYVCFFPLATLWCFFFLACCALALVVSCCLPKLWTTNWWEPHGAPENIHLKSWVSGAILFALVAWKMPCPNHEWHRWVTRIANAKLHVEMDMRLDLSKLHCA